MHPTSRSQLASLALPYVHITKENVDRVQQTLVSPYPAFVTLTAESNDQAEMIQRNVESRVHAGGEKFVAIKRGSKLRIHPRLRSTALPLSKYAIDRPLEVVVTQGKWTCVIGYGFGWVGNAAIVYEDVRAVIPRQPVPLRSFSWVAQMSYNELDVPAVSSLISLMSPGIQSLHLARSRIKTEDLRLAFLSVIGRKLQTTSNAALHHLDVVLVSKIFAFSGTPVKRHVHREHQANMSLSRFAYW